MRLNSKECRVERFALEASLVRATVVSSNVRTSQLMGFDISRSATADMARFNAESRTSITKQTPKIAPITAETKPYSRCTWGFRETEEKVHKPDNQERKIKVLFSSGVRLVFPVNMQPSQTCSRKPKGKAYLLDESR
jgi:hypothetical protein